MFRTIFSEADSKNGSLDNTPNKVSKDTTNEGGLNDIFVELVAKVDVLKEIRVKVVDLANIEAKLKDSATTDTLDKVIDTAQVDVEHITNLFTKVNLEVVLAFNFKETVDVKEASKLIDYIKATDIIVFTKNLDAKEKVTKDINKM